MQSVLISISCSILNIGGNTHPRNNVSKINNGDQGLKYGSQLIHIQMVIHNGGLNGRLNTNVVIKN